MSSVILFSTGCPKCLILQKKLDQKKIEYTKSSNTEEVISKGFMTAPVLKVGEEYMDFSKAINWIKEV